MIDSEGNLVDVSYSMASTFLKCEQQFNLQHVEKLPFGRLPIRMAAGSAFDVAVPTALNPQTRVMTEAVIRQWWKHPVDAKTGEDVELDETTDDDAHFKERSVELALMFARDVAPNLNVVATQEQLYLELGNGLPPISGTLDLISRYETKGIKRRFSLDDTKVSAKSSGWGWETVDTSLQLNWYALVAEQEYPLNDAGYIIARPLKTRAELMLTPRLQVDEERLAFTKSRAVHIVTDICSKVESGLFVPTAFESQSWVCSRKYCQFFDRCDYGAKARRQL